MSILATWTNPPRPRILSRLTSGFFYYIWLGSANPVLSGATNGFITAPHLRKMGLLDSLASVPPKLIEHGINTSPSEGNGYGVALGLSLFFAFTFAGVAAYIYREKQRQTQGYIKRLEKLQDAHRRELAAKQRGNL